MVVQDTHHHRRSTTGIPYDKNNRVDAMRYSILHSIGQIPAISQ